ncbi:MAG: hypothetical protein GQ534_04550, partial [Candidatus Delongbacteria bacterium]|nr:hypothetical protein [Candidatus Delongbacteria bacterium]
SISLSESNGYQSNLSITPINGIVSDTVYVRFEPTTAQSHVGKISHFSQNMETKNIALSGVALFLTIINLIPSDNETVVMLDSNLEILFDKNTIAGIGNIHIKRSSDDSLFETILASSTSISDSVVTIDPVFDLEMGTDYYVLIDSTAFMNVDSFYFRGIYDKEDWNFRSLAYFTDITAGLVGVTNGSVAWGDYDNDGDLDILMTGNAGLPKISKVYRNDPEGFTDINAELTGVYLGSAAWGDYDNDGDLDILLTGYYYEGVIQNYISKVYRNDPEGFTDINAGLIGVYWSSVAWGDYDNDGDLDILLEGDTGSTYITKIYNNDSGDFTDIGAELPNVHRGSLAWGDYDNDGDLDILLSGEDNSSDIICEIYRNDSGIFTDIDAGLEAVWLSSVAWGDYDNDGDLDILLSGFSSRRVSKIYRNDSGMFTDINAVLHEMANGSVAWGDYDNDGDLDVLLTGEDNDGEWVRHSKLYSNNAGVFTEINAGLTGLSSSSAAWGDYDNDADLDILLTGYTGSESISKIYRNDQLVANTVPSSPINLSTSLTDSTVTFSWDKATDNETPQDGLSYNLYIGTVNQKDSVQSSMSDIPTGYRKVVNLGNANQNNSWTIKDLPSGEYYWSVQAIDHAFAGSEFSAEQMLSLSDMLSPQNVTTEIIGSNIKLSWDAVTGAVIYWIFGSDDPYGTFVNVSKDGTLAGETWTVDRTESKKFYYVVAVDGAKLPATTKNVKVEKIGIRN